MHDRGYFAPEQVEETRALFEAAGAAARTVVREVGRALGLDRDEVGERIDADVIRTAHEALFASLLRVSVGTRAEFDDFRAAADLEVIEVGSPNVEHVAWHAVEFADVVVAVTFQHEEDAAVETLRRQVFGRVYAEWLP